MVHMPGRNDAAGIRSHILSLIPCLQVQDIDEGAVLVRKQSASLHVHHEGEPLLRIRMAKGSIRLKLFLSPGKIRLHVEAGKDPVRDPVRLIRRKQDFDANGRRNRFQQLPVVFANSSDIGSAVMIRSQRPVFFFIHRIDDLSMYLTLI